MLCKNYKTGEFLKYLETGKIQWQMDPYYRVCLYIIEIPDSAFAQLNSSLFTMENS
jgi:hypothetical protein